tara:strand:+ start:80 stop:541 length:462 start_codon:yes stop_codon:yes gene_type:complete
MNERFKTDLMLYQRNMKDDNKTIIKDLNEEVANLKKQLSFVYEKDKTINELKIQLMEYTKLVEDYSEYKNKLVSIIKKYEEVKKENTKLTDTNKKLKDIITKLKSEDNLSESDKIKKIVINALLEKEKQRLDGELNDIEISKDNITDTINNLK